MRKLGAEHKAMYADGNVVSARDRLMRSGTFSPICIWRAPLRVGAQTQTPPPAWGPPRLRRGPTGVSVCVLEKVNGLPCGKLLEIFAILPEKAEIALAALDWASLAGD